MLCNYIGLSTSVHDPALAFVDSCGEIVFAEATERFLQKKRAWNSVPDDLMYVGELLHEYCEEGAELVSATTWSKQSRRLLRFAQSVIEGKD